MNDRVDPPKWHVPVLVAAFGGLGGLTAWIWSITVGKPLELGTAGAIAANVFLGVVAGFVGIYAIKLDSSRALMHSLALALLCGFAWKPTLEAGRELVITRIQDGAIAETAREAEQRIGALEKASAETAPLLIEELGSVYTQLMRSGDKIRDPALRAEVDQLVRDSVRVLSDKAEIAPEASARALGSIGAAALREDRGGIADAATGSLLHLAEVRQFEVATSSEVSNSLIRLSAAARAGEREDRAGLLREQSLEIVHRARMEAEVHNDPGAVEELRDRAIVVRELPPREFLERRRVDRP